MENWPLKKWYCIPHLEKDDMKPNVNHYKLEQQEVEMKDDRLLLQPKIVSDI